MIQLKQFSENNWLVTSDEVDRMGLLSKTLSGYVFTVNKVKLKFADETAVNQFFDYDVFSDGPINEKTDEGTIMIEGYPTNNKNATQVFITGNTLPLFSKRKDSKIFYSAGYYCVRYDKGWVSVFCPKHSTLNTYKYVGPFKTEAEMKKNLSIVKRNE